MDSIWSLEPYCFMWPGTLTTVITYDSQGNVVETTQEEEPSSGVDSSWGDHLTYDPPEDYENWFPDRSFESSTASKQIWDATIDACKEIMHLPISVFGWQINFFQILMLDILIATLAWIIAWNRDL